MGKEESRKAALKAKALDRQAKKIKLRLAKERKRKLRREQRLKQRMNKMRQMLALAKKNHKTASVSQKKTAEANIQKLKNEMVLESREDAKQEANLKLKMLIVDAAEKCELAKQKREAMEIAMCKT